MPTATFGVRVIPRAHADRIDGARAGALLARVRAAPESDRANDALRRLIAAELGVRPSAVRVVAGHRSRDKRIRVDGAEGAVAALLRANGIDPDAMPGR